MPALTAEDRVAVSAEYSEALSSNRVPFNLSKPELRAAVAAIDDWLEANAAEFNAALPVAARTTLTPAQKAELLVYVVRKRFTRT